MRTAEEITKDFESSFKCVKEGKRHKFIRDGEPFNMFFDGPGHHHIERLQRMVCAVCGFEKWRKELKLVKKGEGKR